VQDESHEKLGYILLLRGPVTLYINNNYKVWGHYDAQIFKSDIYNVTKESISNKCCYSKI